MREWEKERKSWEGGEMSEEEEERERERGGEERE